MSETAPEPDPTPDSPEPTPDTPDAPAPDGGGDGAEA